MQTFRAVQVDVPAHRTDCNGALALSTKPQHDTKQTFFSNPERHVNYLYLSLMDHHHGQATNQAVKTTLTHIKLMFRQWKM